MNGTTRTQTYPGLFQSQAEDAFRRDAADAARQGWFPAEKRWNGSELIVTYSYGTPAPDRWGTPAGATPAALPGNEQAARKGPRWTVVAATIAVVVLLGLALMGVVSTVRHETDEIMDRVGREIEGIGADPTPGKYTQTWAKGYDVTTCEDWNDRMDAHQRFVLAGDYLITLRRKADPDTGLPSDADIGSFSAGLDLYCDDTDAQLADEDRPIGSIAVLVFADSDYT